MKRRVIHPNEPFSPGPLVEVGNGYQTWNRAIGADIGEIVQCREPSLILWCDEEALCKADPVLNVAASVLTGRRIYGTVIVFRNEDIK